VEGSCDLGAASSCFPASTQRLEMAAHARAGAGSDCRDELQERNCWKHVQYLTYMHLPYACFLLLQVPIEVMSCMSHVPAPYLKQLAEDREIFNELPPAVKQQVGCYFVLLCYCYSLNSEGSSCEDTFSRSLLVDE
jgi:hypothetical protein